MNMKSYKIDNSEEYYLVDGNRNLFQLDYNNTNSAAGEMFFLKKFIGKEVLVVDGLKTQKLTIESLNHDKKTIIASNQEHSLKNVYSVWQEVDEQTAKPHVVTQLTLTREKVLDAEQKEKQKKACLPY
jgi:hypothetical protein